MRINRFVAQATGVGRRQADTYIASGRVYVNDRPASPSTLVSSSDVVTLDDKILTASQHLITIALHKPVGYVCSRDGQGSKTIYQLLPPKYHQLKSIGRLDKDSSGLILLTNDGELANNLTHPSHQKQKLYLLVLDKTLRPEDKVLLSTGVKLEDGVSRLELDGSDRQWEVGMHEGRNRQIRRTFDALGYKVVDLHRTKFGPYVLGNLLPGQFKEV